MMSTPAGSGRRNSSMNPVIQRELCEQARTPTLFRMRVAAAGVLLGTLAWGFFTARGTIQMGGPFPVSGIPAGSSLLLRLHQALAVTLLAITPALTADAIARERREATLGLLGLTPLRPLSVALGKAAANGLRALTLWLAPVPILTVPLLMGGVSAVELTTLVTFQLTLLAVGLVAGLAASAVAIQFRRALALAYGFEVLLLLGLFAVNQMLTSLAFGLAINRFGLHQAAELRWISNSPAQVFGGPYDLRFGSDKWRSCPTPAVRPGRLDSGCSCWRPSWWSS